LVGIWVIVCIKEPSHHFLQTIRPLRMFKIVFRDCSLYSKQLSLFCLLRLIGTSANSIGYITNLCSMTELLHELKNSSFGPLWKKSAYALQLLWALLESKVFTHCNCCSGPFWKKISLLTHCSCC